MTAFSWHPKTHEVISHTVLMVAREKYVEGTQTEPVGIIYSPEDHHYLPALQGSLPFQVLWNSLPGFPRGCWILYGTRGICCSGNFYEAQND